MIDLRPLERTSPKTCKNVPFGDMAMWSRVGTVNSRPSAVRITNGLRDSMASWTWERFIGSQLTQLLGAVKERAVQLSRRVDSDRRSLWSTETFPPQD
jgi:hypothetical protein